MLVIFSVSREHSLSPSFFVKTLTTVSILRSVINYIRLLRLLAAVLHVTCSLVRIAFAGCSREVGEVKHSLGRWRILKSGG